MNEQRSSHMPLTRFLSEPPRVAHGLAGAHPFPSIPRALLLARTFLVLTLAVACAKKEASVCDPVADEFCPQCADGEFTCIYDGVSVTTEACQGCQTRIALHDELCTLGRTDSRADVDASMVCEPVDTAAR